MPLSPADLSLIAVLKKYGFEEIKHLRRSLKQKAKDFDAQESKPIDQARHLESEASALDLADTSLSQLSQQPGGSFPWRNHPVRFASTPPWKGGEKFSPPLMRRGASTGGGVVWMRVTRIRNAQ